MSGAIVTGGSGGIGAATCRALAAAGHHVLVGYGGNAAAAEDVVASCGANATALHIDVTDEAALRPPWLTATVELGTLAVVVNNAGVTNDDLLLRLDADRFDDTIDVNLRGAYLLSRAALRPMLKGSSRPHRQCLVGRRTARQRRTDGICGVEGGPHRVHQVAGA
jgi:3-oxoacyl-[acyl-carrier protein] reductase